MFIIAVKNFELKIYLLILKINVLKQYYCKKTREMK